MNIVEMITMLRQVCDNLTDLVQEQQQKQMSNLTKQLEHLGENPDPATSAGIYPDPPTAKAILEPDPAAAPALMSTLTQQLQQMRDNLTQQQQQMFGSHIQQVNKVRAVPSRGLRVAVYSPS